MNFYELKNKYFPKKKFYLYELFHFSEISKSIELKPDESH